MDMACKELSTLRPEIAGVFRVVANAKSDAENLQSFSQTQLNDVEVILIKLQINF